MHVDSHLLTSLGVNPVPGPVLVPLYVQKKMVPCSPDLDLFRADDQDPELQSLACLVLQVEDGAKFRR